MFIIFIFNINPILDRIFNAYFFKEIISQKKDNILLIIFNKRHILSHNEGIVDEKYLAKSGDNRYSLGQRIVISEDDVDSIVKLISKLADNIKARCS